MVLMAELDRSPSRTPRRVREQRAYRLALSGGTLAVVAVVGFVLALVGIVGPGIPIIAAVLAAVCALLFRRAVSS